MTDSFVKYGENSEHVQFVGEGFEMYREGKYIEEIKLDGDITVKDEIVLSFLDLVEEKSLNKITVGAIMSKCGHSRQTFYRYFLDINDLTEYIHENVIEHSLQAFIGTRSLYDSLVIFYKDILKHKNFYREIIKYTGQNNFLEHFYQSMMVGTKEQYGHDRLNDRFVFAMELYWTGATVKLGEWIRNGFDLTPETLADYMVAGIPEGYSPLEVVLGEGN